MCESAIGYLLLLMGGTILVGVFGACCVELVQKIQR